MFVAGAAFAATVVRSRRRRFGLRKRLSMRAPMGSKKTGIAGGRLLLIETIAVAIEIPVRS
jgi:hypothetical protein